MLHYGMMRMKVLRVGKTSSKPNLIDFVNVDDVWAFWPLITDLCHLGACLFMSGSANTENHRNCASNPKHRFRWTPKTQVPYSCSCLFTVTQGHIIVFGRLWENLRVKVDSLATLGNWFMIPKCKNIRTGGLSDLKNDFKMHFVWAGPFEMTSNGCS